MKSRMLVGKEIQEPEVLTDVWVLLLAMSFFAFPKIRSLICIQNEVPDLRYT